MSGRPQPIPERAALAGLLLAMAAAPAGAQAPAPGAAATAATAQSAFEERSIMLLPAEIEQIEAALRPAGPAPVIESALEQVVAAGPAAPAVLPNIYLNGVTYLGPERWTLWVNDRRIDSGRGDPEFRVVAIGPGAARLRWQVPGRAEPVTVTLQPHQTYLAETGEVREGDLRVRADPAAAGAAGAVGRARP